MQYSEAIKEQFIITWSAEDAFGMEESFPLPNSLVIQAMNNLFSTIDYGVGLGWDDLRLTLQTQLRNFINSDEDYQSFLPKPYKSLELLHHTIEPKDKKMAVIYNVWLRVNYVDKDSGYSTVEEFDRDFLSVEESIRYAGVLSKIFSLEIEKY